MKIGIIGYGNIGQLLSKNLINVEEVLVSTRTLSKLDDIQDKVTICKSNKQLAKSVDKIIISVKTNQLINILNEIDPVVSEEIHIIHTCAGITFKDLETFSNYQISCIIPTIASTYTSENLKKGYSLCIHNDNVCDKNKKYIEELFSKFSYLKTIDNFDDLYMAMIATSCMPAFISLATDLLSQKFSDLSGFTYEAMLNLLTETVNSSSMLLKENVYSCDELMNKVATKNGITQKGLDYLHQSLPVIYDDLMNKLL